MKEFSQAVCNEKILKIVKLIRAWFYLFAIAFLHAKSIKESRLSVLDGQ